MLKLLPFLFTMIVLSAYAADYKKLKKLVQYEVDLLEKSQLHGDEVHYRLFELYSERLKLTFYDENQNFLKVDDPGKHNKKNSFFPETQKLFSSTQDFGNGLLKKFPKTKRKSDILYTLALNARDFNGGAGSEKLLRESLKLATKSGQAFHARTSLAETLYNDKKYPEAVAHYEEVVKNLEDPWLPKHWLNLGWCYMKTDKMDKAIDALQTAYNLAGTKKYIDIKAQVAQNLVPFWVQSGQVEQGMIYYKKNVTDPYDNLLSLAKKASDRGFNKETELIFSEIKKDPSFSKNFDRQEELLLFKLNFYRQTKDWSAHYATSVELLALKKQTQNLKPVVELKLFLEMLEEVKAVAGFHQMTLSKNINKGDDGDFDKSDADYVLKYFNLLQFLNPDEKALYLYYIAESYYGIKNYSEALKYYKAGLSFFDARFEKKEQKNQPVPFVSLEKPDLDKKMLTSLLALAGEEKFSDKENHEVLIYTYASYIRHLPKDEVSKDIYPKLFKLYLSDSKDVEATYVMRKYALNFEKDLSLQQDLLKELLNYYIKHKNEEMLTEWIFELKKGYLSFTTQDIDKTEVVLADILFFNAFAQSKKGDFEGALSQFERVYKKTNYPDRLRAKAAFYAGEISLDANKKSAAINWFEKSIQVNNDQDLQVESDTWIRILDKLSFLYEMRGSVRLLNQLLDRTCKMKTAQQDTIFQRVVNYHLVLADDYLTKNFLQKQKQCLSNPSTYTKVLDLMMSFYTEHNEFSKLVTTYQLTSHKPEEVYTKQLIELFWENPEIEKDIIKELKKIKRDEAQEIVNQNEKKELFLKSQLPLLQKKFAHLEPFDGEKFSVDLDQYLKEVQAYISAHKDLSKEGGSHFQSAIVKIWSKFYSSVESKILNIKIKEDPDLVASFENEMKNVAKPFGNEARKLFKMTMEIPDGDRKSTFVHPIALSNAFDLKEISSNMYLNLCFSGKMDQFLKEGLDHYKKNAKDWQYWAQLGNCLLWKGSLREAMFYLKSAQALAKAETEKGEVLLLLGVAYLKLGLIHKGFDYLEDARKKIPSNKMVSYNLALIYLHFDQPHKALEYLSGQDDNNSEVTFFKGLSFLQKNEAREAKRYLSRLPDNYSKRDDSSLAFAKLSLMEGSWIEAEKILNKRTASKFQLIEARQKELQIEIQLIKDMRFNK